MDANTRTLHGGAFGLGGPFAEGLVLEDVVHAGALQSFVLIGRREEKLCPRSQHG